MTTTLHTAITLAAPLILVTLGYGLACWIWPFRPCHTCRGHGKRRSLTGRTLRYCHRCKGTGARLRAGRWLYNTLSRLHREAR